MKNLFRTLTAPLKVLTALAVMATIGLFEGGVGTPPPAPADPPPDPPAPTPTPDPEAEAAARAAAEKAAAEKIIADQARAARDAELAEQYGKTPDEIAEMIKREKEAADAHKSQAERDAIAAAEARAAAEATQAKADKILLDARIKTALESAGVPNTGSASVVALISVASDATDEVIAAAIATKKTELPGLFTGPTGTEGPPSSEPPTPNPGGPPGKSASQTGRDAYRARNPKPEPAPAG